MLAIQQVESNYNFIAKCTQKKGSKNLIKWQAAECDAFGMNID